MRGLATAGFLAGAATLACQATSYPSAADNGVVAVHILGANIQPGKGVILLRTQIDAYDSEAAEEGFLQTMLHEYPKIPILVSDYHTGGNVTTAQRIAQGRFEAHRERLGGVFASGENASKGAVAALTALGMDVPIVGRVDSVETADALRQAYPLFNGIVAAPRQHTATDVGFLAHEPPPAKWPYTPGPKDRRIDDIGLELVYLKGGAFTMGRERALETLLPAFYVGRFEVTQAQWEAVMGTNPSIFKSSDRPVDNVSWEDAVAFCAQLTARERAAGAIGADERFSLPTQAQWEYACLAGGADVPVAQMDAVGWQMRTSGRAYQVPNPRKEGGEKTVRRMSTQPVGAKKPNLWGIFDMYGNVNEWCLDTWKELPEGEIPDFREIGEGKYRLLKGGCWWADPASCSAFSRHKAPVNRHHSALGFRVVLEGDTMSPKK